MPLGGQKSTWQNLKKCPQFNLVVKKNHFYFGYLYKCKECDPEGQWSWESEPSKLSTFINDLGLCKNRLKALLIFDLPLGAAVVEEGPERKKIISIYYVNYNGTCLFVCLFVRKNN